MLLLTLRWLVICGFSLGLPVFGATINYDDRPVWDSVHLCDIPNEAVPGECKLPAECAAYGKINDVVSLGSVERFSFIREIQCNVSDWEPYVCCPRNRDTYLAPYINATMEEIVRISSRSGDERCGMQTFEPKIRGGQFTEIDEFPWMAMLLYQRGSSEPVQGCGGALISRSYVITAAHCITGKSFEQSRGRLKFVRLKEHNVMTDPDCVRHVRLEKEDCAGEKIDLLPQTVIPHPEYESESSHQRHDIGLIRIEMNAPFDDFLRTICLPDQNFESSATAGKILSVAGWGKTDIFKDNLGPDVLSPIKLKLSLPYVDRERCNEAFLPWQFSPGPGQMCAGGERAKDTCAGDSGSPLMSYDMKRGIWHITGVVSFGVQTCGTRGIPGVYTNVHHYLPWIKKYIGICSRTRSTSSLPFYSQTKSVSAKIIIMLLVPLLLLALGANAATDSGEDRPVWDSVRLCDIPNEAVPGECKLPVDCAAYGKINDVASLGSIERFSFIKQVQCNASDVEPLVCCPRNSDVYLEPYVNETMVSKNRVTSRIAFDIDSCGIQTFEPKIRGGQLAEIDEFPWMAMLLYQRGNSPPVQGCGGALISHTYVITAAHCVTGRNFQQTKGNLKYVRLREYNIHTNPDCVYENNLKDCSEDMIDLPPKAIIPHPQYDSESSHQQHDIALVRIEQTPPFTDFLRSICLPDQDFESSATAGKKLSVSGWGKTDIFKDNLGPDVLSPIKLKLSLPYVDRERCNKSFRPWQFSLGPGQMCAGGERAKDTCAGDSGSPLMSYDMKRGIWHITGVVSLGVRACGVEGLPGVYTNVHHYLPWIRMYTE
uniref:Peptidase S1 domain-containing protein n=1 Tax=Anopheles farauti TaxID=69004 RepID=A0A182QCA1_9DIPT